MCLIITNQINTTDSPARPQHSYFTELTKKTDGISFTV
jgi:hypothetical protein